MTAGEQWLPWYRTRFDEGQDIAPNRAAEMVRILASGQVDRLSGTFLSSTDDLATMLQRIDETMQNPQVEHPALRPGLQSDDATSAAEATRDDCPGL